MSSRRPIAERILPCALAVLLAVAFLLPPKAPTPQDGIRAAYAAQGLLCAPTETGTAIAESHCVLCLFPAFHTPCETGSILSLRIAKTAEPTQPSAPAERIRNVAAWHARAPPVSVA